LIINNPFLPGLTCSGLEGLSDVNVNGLTQTRAPSWDVENLYSRILYVVHNACHHVASAGIKQEDRLYVTNAVSTYGFKTRYTQIRIPRLSIQARSWHAYRFSGGKAGKSLVSVLAPGFPLKTTKGHKKPPDAVTVTTTVTCNVADNEVRPSAVLAPAWERFFPSDMSKKIGVWSMLMTKHSQQLIAVSLGLTKLMKSIVSLRRTSGGRWHSCVTCRSTILFVWQKRRTARSFALSVFL
jgi:hypothetical protein